MSRPPAFSLPTLRQRRSAGARQRGKSRTSERVSRPGKRRCDPRITDVQCVARSTYLPQHRAMMENPPNKRALAALDCRRPDRSHPRRISAKASRARSRARGLPCTRLASRHHQANLSRYGTILAKLMKLEVDHAEPGRSRDCVRRRMQRYKTTLKITQFSQPALPRILPNHSERGVDEPLISW